ncbi:MAG: glycoside hydrolase [Spirochaetia bacterium]|nr:glycoside hydrolase [Spirochaetia bacterium]
MKTLKNKIIVAFIALGLAAGGYYFFAKPKQHKHVYYGDVSFDVYAESDKTHMILFERQKREKQKSLQKLTYIRFDENMNESRHELNIDFNEEIISKRTNDIQIAAYKNNIAILWEVKGTGFKNRGPIRSAYSTDGGKSWLKGQNPVDTNSMAGQAFFDIVSDSRGIFHITWLDTRDEVKGLRYAYSKDKGNTWSKNVTVDKASCFCCWNVIKANKENEIFILYRNEKPRDMAFIKVNLNAETDDVAYDFMGHVDKFNWGFEGCPHVGAGFSFDDNNRIHAVTWTGEKDVSGVYYQNSNDKGKSFTEAEKMGTSFASNPDVAVNGKEVVVVWDQIKNEKKVVMTSVSKDAGKTWSKPVIISDENTMSMYAKVIFTNQKYHVFYSEKTGHDFKYKKYELNNRLNAYKKSVKEVK